MSKVLYIRSDKNKKIKLVKNLIKGKKERNKNKLFIAEGLKVIEQIAQNNNPLELFCSEVFYARISARREENTLIKKSDCRINILSEKCFNKISLLTHSEGIVALFPHPQRNIKELIRSNNALAILCENLQDPTNIGSIIRNCFCLGANALLLTHRSVDMYNPKVIRASAGYIMKIPVFYINYDVIREFKKNEFYIYASEFKDKKNSNRIDTLSNLPKKLIYAFGSEGKGLSQKIINASDKQFYIPMREGSESLNVSSAIAITLFTQFSGMSGL